MAEIGIWICCVLTGQSRSSVGAEGLKSAEDISAAARRLHYINHAIQEAQPESIQLLDGKP